MTTTDKVILNDKNSVFALIHTFGGADLCAGVTLHETQAAADIAMDKLMRERWAFQFSDEYMDDTIEREGAGALNRDDVYADAADVLSNECNETFEVVRLPMPDGFVMVKLLP